MQFQWCGNTIRLQGIRERSIQGISSSQLKRLHATKSISEFFHVPLSTSNSTGTTDLAFYPSDIQPLLQEYNCLFREPQALPPTRNNTHHIHLMSNVGQINAPLLVSSLAKTRNQINTRDAPSGNNSSQYQCVLTRCFIS